jgi:hypothetical protein
VTASEAVTEFVNEKISQSPVRITFRGRVSCAQRRTALDCHRLQPAVRFSTVEKGKGR